MSRKKFDQSSLVNKFFSPKITQEADEALQTHEVQEVKSVNLDANYSDIKTQGNKKGEKLPRMNLAVSPKNYNYLKLISKLEGLTVTAYINLLIEKDLDDKKDYILQLQQVKNSFK